MSRTEPIDQVLARLVRTGEQLSVHARPVASDRISLHARIGDHVVAGTVDRDGSCVLDTEAPEWPVVHSPTSLGPLVTVFVTNGWYVLVDRHVSKVGEAPTRVSLTAIPPEGHGLSRLAVRYGTELIDVQAVWRLASAPPHDWCLDRSATGLRASAERIALDEAALIGLATSASAG